MRRMIPWAGVVLCCALVGCGPMTAPLPQRLDAEDQKRTDEAWTAALTPPTKHTRQEWLDVMVLVQAYQVGVDELDFRSVKKWDGGTVEMTIKFDRAKPADDRFTLTVKDKAGKALRTETYTREDVERTTKELAPPPVPDDHPEMKAYKARVAGVEAMLPKPKEEPAEPKK